MLFNTDLGTYDKWKIKASDIHLIINCKITISTLIENETTDFEKSKGLDIVDYIISETFSKGN
ncbi:MAG: hypothetical protein WCK78_19310 [Paludibacter sp.]